jgi:hypothetical protein
LALIDNAIPVQCQRIATFGLVWYSERMYNSSSGGAAGSLRCIIAPTPTDLHCIATVAMMKR